MGKNIAKTLVKGAANAWVWNVAVPQAYKKAQAGVDAMANTALLFEENDQYMSPQLEAVFNALESRTSLDVHFVSLKRAMGIGWDEFYRRTMDLVQEAAAARIVVAPEGGDVAECFKGIKGLEFYVLREGVDVEAAIAECLHTVDLQLQAPKKPVEERLAAQPNANPIDISIVVPVYNGERTIERAVESVATQNYPLERMQLVVVNDGSTDGTWDCLQAMKQKYPELLTLSSHDAPSGTPAAPRNTGLSIATGEYVFFLDADDWFGPEAVRRMLTHAYDWGSDMLMAKIAGENGRHAPQSMFKLNQPDADKWSSKIMWSLAPYRLYRRSAIEGLRFPESYMPEDIPFVLQALDRAKTVSVAADYDYYHLAFDGDGNASFGIWKDIPRCLQAYREIFPMAAGMQGFKPGCFLARRLLKVDLCRTVCALAEDGGQQAREQFEEMRELALPLYVPGVDQKIGGLHGAVIHAALEDESPWEALCALVESGQYRREEIYDEPDSKEAVTAVANDVGGRQGNR